MVPALYLADKELTVWAEWYRHLAELGIPPMASLPRDLWVWWVGNLKVAGLSSAERLERVGLTRPVPDRQTWPRYQTVGEALWRTGWPGLLAQSAARPQGLVLCLFLPSAFSTCQPIPPPTVVREPPVPPTGMVT